MILVDSSVWIEILRGRVTPETARFTDLAGQELIAIGDLNLAEVLQGCPDDISFERTRRYLAEFQLLPIGGKDVAVAAARNFIRLRDLGVTIRTTIDTLIATRCIIDGHALLHRDRDFQPFVEHLDLIDAMTL